MKITLLKTRNYKWRLLTLKSGKPYVVREFTSHGLHNFLTR